MLYFSLQCLNKLFSIVTLPISATVFEIGLLTLKARKSLNFPTPSLFEAPLGGNPLEFCDEIWHQKTRIMGLPGVEIMTLDFFVLTQYRLVTDGRTDGQTDKLLSQRPALAQRRSGKKLSKIS